MLYKCCQVGGENVEANPETGGNSLGLGEDAEGIWTSHLETSISTKILLFVFFTELMQDTHQCPRFWIEDVGEVLFAAKCNQNIVLIKNKLEVRPLWSKGIPVDMENSFGHKPSPLWGFPNLGKVEEDFLSGLFGGGSLISYCEMNRYD